MNNNPGLSPKQKNHFLALEAEAILPYLSITDNIEQAMKDGGDVYKKGAESAPFHR